MVGQTSGYFIDLFKRPLVKVCKENSIQEMYTHMLLVRVYLTYLAYRITYSANLWPKSRNRAATLADKFVDPRVVLDSGVLPILYRIGVW